MHPLSPQGKIIWKGLEGSYLYTPQSCHSILTVRTPLFAFASPGYEESMGMFMECQKLMNNHIVEPKRLFRPIYSDKDLTNL